MRVLAWMFLLLLLAFLRTGQLVEELDHRPRGSARHPSLRQVGIELVLALHAHAGDVEMDPIDAVDELVEEGGGLAGTAVTVAFVVHVVRSVARHLLREELPQGHPPDAIARDHAGLANLGPQGLGVAEDAAGCRTQSRPDPRR